MALPRVLVIVLALLGPLLVVPSPGVSTDCDQDPVYDTSVTNPGDHADGFPDREITTYEIVSYFDLVGQESDRVVTGSFGTSIGGTDLVYSLVSTPENIARVDEIAADQNRLRDPRETTPAQAADIAANSPAIVWYTGNVHGNEPSGADAAVTILHDLAARTDCGVDVLLENLVVGILPTQNPDGRDDNSRTNRYGFDMNRDWFAGSQPESAGKLELLKQYPPVLYIDAHQMGGGDFFFPPNADPIHHEISDASVDWINNLYGAAMQEEFDRRAEEAGPASTDWDYFNYNVYDLFYMGYGDTVPSTAYGAAGMTFEKGSSDSASQRHLEQLVAGWVSLQQAAWNKTAILQRHYDSHVQAIADGAAGRLEDNLVVEPQNSVEFEVPEQTVRHYFLLPDESGEGNLNRLIDRLQRTDVEIYALTEDLDLAEGRLYGREAGAMTVPAGAYWIPMAQPQKRWIQALLGEDPYTPFPYFYDVTSWSNPLLMDVTAVIAADVLEPAATLLTERPALTVEGNGPVFGLTVDSADAVAATIRATEAGFAVGAAAGQAQITATAAQLTTLLGDLPLTLRTTTEPALPPFTAPKVAVFNGSGESGSHLRFMLDHVWQIPYDSVSVTDVAAGVLTTGGYDVFLVPGVTASTLIAAAPQIHLFVQAGGTYVGTNRSGATGGTSLATQIGLTTARSTPLAGAEVGGTAFRVDLADAVVTAGSPDDEAFWFNLGENVLSASTTGSSPVTYSTGEDFWFSGYGTGVDGLAGTSVVVHEAAGQGNVVLFSGEPNFRAYTEGPSFLLLNALLVNGPDDQPAGARDVTSPLAAADVAAAQASVAGRLDQGPGRPITMQVERADLDAAMDVITGFTTDLTTEPTDRGTVLIRIPNPNQLDFESHPFIHQLRHAFETAGVALLSAQF